MLNATERKRFGFLAVANAIVSLADIAALAMLLAIVAFYTQESSSLSRYFPWFDTQHALWPACLFLLFFVIKNVLAFWLYNVQARFVYRVASRISRNQLLHYLKGPYSDYATVDSSKQNHLINTQPIEFAHYVLSGIQQIFTESVLILLAVVAIIMFNAKLFLMLMIFLLPAVLLSVYYMRRRLRSARTSIKADAGIALQYLQEAINGYVESQVYGRKHFFTGRFTRQQARFNEHLAGLQIAQWIPGRLVEVFAVCGLFLMITINVHYGTVIGPISIGAFLAAAYKIIPGIGRITNQGAQIRIYAYTLDNLAKAQVAEVDLVGTMPDIESIMFSKVSFTHGESPLLRQFDLQLKRGDFACVVAPSGRGKTTVLNLLLGFLSPSAGEIRINGKALSAEQRRDLQSCIAYVKQQPFFIHDTIAGNITLSEREPDKRRLEQAIDVAGLRSLISTFPDASHKMISGNGKDISGGQGQRIALARALYRDAGLFILDEPFSEMDEQSERQLLDYFRSVAASGKIVLLVSHSSHAQAYCNKIVVLDE